MANPHFESIESRTLFAGNVAVALTPSRIIITGDAKANSVAIVAAPSGDGIVISGSGATINGKPRRITLPIRNKLIIDMGGGSDTLTIDRLAQSTGRTDVGIQMGAGDDALYLKRPRVKAADIYGGDGNDSIDITAARFGKRLRIFCGEQDDVTALRNVHAVAGLEITDTAGRAIIAMVGITSGDGSFVSTGNSRDSLSITDSIFEGFSARLRGGNDTSVVTHTQFAVGSMIDGGEGIDDIVDDA